MNLYNRFCLFGTHPTECDELFPLDIFSSSIIYVYSEDINNTCTYPNFLLTVIEWQTAFAWESSKCLCTPRKCRLEMLPFRFNMLFRRSNGLLSDWVEDAFLGSLISSHPVRVLDRVRLLVFEFGLDVLWFW